MKKLTINDIAKLANTSKTTVSFYLNGKFQNMSKQTKEKISKVIEQYDYTPNLVARSLSKSKTNLIAVLVGDITNGFSNQLVKGIEKRVEETGYRVIISSSEYDKDTEKNSIRTLIQMGIDGFIIQPTKDFKDNIEEIKKSGAKFTFIDSVIDNSLFTSIKADNYNSVYTCMNEIIKGNWYKRYLMIGANAQTLSTRKERAQGFKDSLEKEGLDYIDVVVSNNPTLEEVEEKLISCIDTSVNTLVFSPNCWLLQKVFKALRRYEELMPSKIGLLGFDNTEWTSLSSPTVTTIVQPVYEEGYLAASKLIEQLEDKGEVSTHTLVCRVDWKESVYRR